MTASDVLLIVLFVIPIVVALGVSVILILHALVVVRKEIWRWLKENRVFFGVVLLLALLLLSWLYDITDGMLLAALFFSFIAAAFTISAYVTRNNYLYWVAIGVVVLSVWAGKTGASYRAEKNLAESGQSTESAQQLSTKSANDQPSVDLSAPTELQLESESAYFDERWPTTNSELLAISEADRWYNARNKVGSQGAIAGPVASVVPLDNRVMINIGNDYPNLDRAQVVIWGEDVSAHAELLDAIDDGGAWISITAHITSYGGVPEIEIGDGSWEYTWWTNVR